MPEEPRTIIKERITPLPEGDIDPFAMRCLARKVYFVVQNYYKDPNNRKEFDEWYLATYGKPYVWKTVEETLAEKKALEEQGNES